MNVLKFENVHITFVSRFFSPFYAFLSMSFSVFIIVSDITRALLRLERTMNLLCH